MKSTSAIFARHDQSGCAHYLLPNQLGNSTERFERAVRAYLSQEWKLDPEHALVFCLVAFDGIIDRVQLQQALESLPDAYGMGGKVCIEWTTGAQLNRRLLSTWTVCSLSALPKPWAASRAQEIIISIDSHIRETLDKRGMNGLLIDAASWQIATLSGPASGHTTGISPMTSLQRDCLAREDRQLPLARPVDPDGETITRALGATLSSYFNSRAVDGGQSLLDEVLGAARKKNRREALGSLVELANRTQYVGPITALITAWVLDLVESGTRRNPNLSQHTVEKYTRLAAKPLLTEFSRKQIEDLGENKFAEAYNSIIDETKESEKKQAASALTSWHDFLVCWLQVPPLKRSLHKDLPESRVRANILWDHEIALIDEWLTRIDENDRVLAQVRVLWTLMRNGRFRIGEALSLTLSQVMAPSSREQQILVSLAPTRRAKLKTFSAERVIEISDSCAVATIKNWITRRLEVELAFPEDLLFGDPHQPSAKYRIGEVYTTLNQLLKSASGDSKLASHALSHTWVCKQIDAATVANEKNHEVNPYDQIASRAGHATAVSTFRYYYHTPEKLIREEIDDAVLKFIDWRHLRNSLDISHDAFRKRMSRSDPDRKSNEIKALLQKSAPKLTLPKVSAPFQFNNCPTCPFGISTNDLTFKSTLNLVSDLLRGLPINVAASRLAVPEQTVVQTRDALILELRATLKKDRWDSLTSIVGAQHFSNAYQIRRTGHPKLASLKSQLMDMKASLSGVVDGVNAWRKCFRGGYISALGPELAPLLSFLSRAQVSADDVVLSYSSGPAGIGEDCLNSIRVLVTKELGLPPQEISQSHRRGRPAAHIQIGVARSDAWNDRDGAALSMAGFNALMLIAAVFLRVSGIEKE